MGKGIVQLARQPVALPACGQLLDRGRTLGQSPIGRRQCVVFGAQCGHQLHDNVAQQRNHRQASCRGNQVGANLDRVLPEQKRQGQVSNDQDPQRGDPAATSILPGSQDHRHDKQNRFDADAGKSFTPHPLQRGRGKVGKQ